jgi:hypothetical protein
MRAGDGDIPSVLCGRANSLRDCCANIRHSNYGPDGPRQLWLEVRFQLLPKERGWIKTMSSFGFETPVGGRLFKARCDRNGSGNCNEGEIRRRICAQAF